MFNRNFISPLRGFLFLSLTLFAPFLRSSASDGGGSSVGGGGTVIKLADDTVIMADAYIVGSSAISGTRIELGNALRTEVLRVRDLLPMQIGYDFMDYYLPMYQTFLQNERPSGPANARAVDPRSFFDENVLGKNTEYLLVDEIPGGCPHSVAKVHGLPTGAYPLSGACTVGGTTYLLRNAFAKMSIREQAKLLIHERMHAEPVPSSIDLEEILARVGSGIEVLLSQYDREQKGIYAPLSDAQLGALHKMSDTIQQYGFFRFPKTKEPIAVKRHSNGGGTVGEDSKVSPEAYIGIAAHVRRGSDVSAGVIFTTQSPLACWNCRMEAGAAFVANVLNRGHITLQLGEQTEISGSTFTFKGSSFYVTSEPRLPDELGKIEISEKSTVRQSRLTIDSKGAPRRRFVVTGGSRLDRVEYEAFFTRRNHRWKVLPTLPVSVPAFLVGMTGAAIYSVSFELGKEDPLMQKYMDIGGKLAVGKVEFRIDGVTEAEKVCAPIRSNHDSIAVHAGCNP